MKKGVTKSEVAVYLPTEDAWIEGELPVEKQFIWAWGAYEQRYTYLPEELRAWRPLWINGEFLGKAQYLEGRLRVGDLSFAALYIDVKYMDKSALKRVAELAAAGLPICLKQIPAEPGLKKSGREYRSLVGKLQSFPNVKTGWPAMNIPPLVTGTERCDFWCRESDEDLFIFFANPKAQQLKFPLGYGQSLSDKTENVDVSIYHNGKTFPVSLKFLPYQSVLLHIPQTGKMSFIDISFTPKTPVYKPRIKTGKEKWEVEQAGK
jgi:hypothetical protein